jgi:hypothetical protein
MREAFAKGMTYGGGGTAGTGFTDLHTNGALAGSASGYITINIGTTGAADFSGLLSIYGVSNSRAVINVGFGGYLQADGTVIASGIGTKTGFDTANLTIAAPVALAAPTPGQFRIQLTEATATAQAFEIKVSMARNGGQATAISFA